MGSEGFQGGDERHARWLNAGANAIIRFFGRMAIAPSEYLISGSSEFIPNPAPLRLTKLDNFDLVLLDGALYPKDVLPLMDSAPGD